ncbi:MAG: aldo/keto reductase [Lysobacterales bacterium]|nr:MAG: aldo/keto reductase [Xanthomonadales bacterium]
MQYQRLRGTGATVSRLSLGAMTFGAQTDEATAKRIIDSALYAGINFIDTADVYVGGVSEEIVGRALKGKRNKVVLDSKVRGLTGEDMYKDEGLHRWHIIHGVEASLKRLGVDCLDICYMHRPDRNTPIEETLAAFDSLVQQGKVMYVGMSNFSSWRICRAKWVADVGRYPPPVVTQVPYNLLARGIEEELLPFTCEMDVGVTCYNPLAAGLLTGKHRKTMQPIENTRFSLSHNYYNRYWMDSNITAVETLASIAEKAGKTLLELALQWLLAQSTIDYVIFGVSQLEHLEQNVQADEGALDAETLAACDEVWATLRGDYFRYNR